MSAYTYIAVSGQNTIGLNATTNTLTLAGGNGIVLTTNATTNTVNISVSPTLSLTSLNVTSTLNINPSTSGTLDNISIGSTTPRPGTFTTLTGTGGVNLSPANAPVTISPTGSGVIIINPATTGTLDNIAIGATTPAAATFTTVNLTSTQQFASNSAVTKNFATALSVAYGIAMS
jgi:hypothetical protein